MPEITIKISWDFPDLVIVPANIEMALNDWLGKDKPMVNIEVEALEPYMSIGNDGELILIDINPNSNTDASDLH
jgi:hypothetical protein